MEKDCILVESENLRFEIARSLGPRILGLSFMNGPNLLADLPEFTVLRPDGKTYHFYGGHRLWLSPEDAIFSYGLEDEPVKIVPVENGLNLIRPADAESGIEKSIQIEFLDDTAGGIITHQLKNCSRLPVRCAAWAITQFHPGGTAILPMNVADTGFLPNQNLAFWPYSDLGDPNFQMGRRYILVNAAMQSPFKIGFANPKGWLAYWLEGVLFVKFAHYDPQAAYPDLGSSSECYCNSLFLELETLSPLQEILPGDSILHVETWRLFHAPARPQSGSDVQRLVEQLGVM